MMGLLAFCADFGACERAQERVRCKTGLPYANFSKTCDDHNRNAGNLVCLFDSPLPHLNVSPSQSKQVDGKLLAMLTTADAMNNRGIAVNIDGSVLAVCNYYGNKITLYALPGGNAIRSFGEKGPAIVYPWKLCFTPGGNIIVTEQIHKRIHEVTADGTHVRFIGSEQSMYMGLLHGVAANEDVVVVSDSGSLTRQIMVFDYRSGGLLRGFGARGSEPGKLSGVDGVCFTPDASQIAVAESDNDRLSVFTLTGEFVRTIGDSDVLSKPADVCVTDGGQFVVANLQRNNLVVFSADGFTVMRQVSAEGVGDEKLRCPDSIAYFGGKLYVLNLYSQRVHVFE
jgi:DNA-binding beta-propeller fold protein YncE